MKGEFSLTSSVTRMTAELGKVERRVARERCLIFVGGDAGFGKSEMLEWHAVQTRGSFVRCKTGMTRAWLGREILSGYGARPAQTWEKCVGAIQSFVLDPEHRHRGPIVIDEVDHIAHSDVREAIRDISDTTQRPILIGGTAGAAKTLQALPAWSTRIYATVIVGKLTADDLRLVWADNREIDAEMAPDLVAAILEHTQGRLRSVLDVLGEIEHRGRKLALPRLSLADVGLAVGLKPAAADGAKPRRAAA